MKLNQPLKILIGLATAWTVLYPLLFLAAWLAMFFGMFAASQSQAGPAPFFAIFPLIFPLHCLTILIMLALQAVYLIHVIRNVAASETIRIILGVGVFFMPFVAMPIYYYLYIWCAQPPTWALAPTTHQPN